jgi:hypothetical protein
MKVMAPAKRLTTAALRFVAEDVADRLQTNLTAEERRELRALIAQSRDDLKALATDRERRRLRRLVRKALTADGG